MKQSLKKVKKIIAASNYIRENLIANGVEQDKIEVVHNGIDRKLFHPIIGLSSYIVDVKPFAIKRPYFVYGSRLSGPEKKHIELIKAFALFKEKTKLPHRLVIAGEGPYDKEIHQAVMNSSVASDIFLTGFFPHKSFPMMYAGSEACVFPSVNEGVGLPILEAMATGVPVLCSKSGALPEIAGDAAYYFDSDNIEEIATGLERIVTDNELRSTLTNKGIERVEAFDWELTVAKTLEIAKEDLENATRKAFEMGWNSVKLYFMIGLPTETYDDLDGIADLAYKVIDMYRDVNGGKLKRAFGVTVSTSTFVPKPFTPFQWWIRTVWRW